MEANRTEPLYLQVARALKEEILSGLHPLGSQLPTEDALRARFAVSRYTIREALRRLRDDGLVVSRQGAGTTVTPSHESDLTVHHTMSINDLMAFAAGSRLAIQSIKMVTIDARLAARTSLPVGEEWLQVRCFRQGDDLSPPTSWTEYYIHRDYAAVGRLLQRHTGPVFPLIEDMFGQRIVEVHQQISATLISPGLAEILDVEPGSAALEVRRIFRTAEGRIAQVTINTDPASRVTHSMTMRRGKADR